MPSRGSTSLGSPKHLSRFIRQKSGKTIEEIAAEDNVTIEQVKNSIRAVEFKQGYHTNEYLQQNLIGLVLRLAPAAQGALLSALSAEKRRDSVNDRGEKITIAEPDHDTQLRAVAEFQKIAVAAQPKVGNQTNVKVGVGLNVAAGQASGSYVGLEERMRELRQKRKEQPIIEGSTVQAVSLIAGQSVMESGDGDDE
ncbi:MAG: hypothetical protein WA734_13940 [Candidatus Acidiferrales bacterium]